MRFEHIKEKVLEFCLNKFWNILKGKGRNKLVTFSFKLTVSVITELTQLPDAIRAKTVASSLEDNTRPSTEVQGNEEGLAYIQKTTPLETKSLSWIGLR